MGGGEKREGSGGGGLEEWAKVVPTRDPRTDGNLPRRQLAMPRRQLAWGAPVDASLVVPTRDHRILARIFGPQDGNFRVGRARRHAAAAARLG